MEQDLGPYFLDDAPVRSDVVEDREGVALELGIRLALPGGEPARSATVDVWQCDALGRYSGVEGVATSADAASARFLRGRLAVDTDGTCVFTTIYPGWYEGRTPHIHVLAHDRGRRYVSQLFFPDELTDAVHRLPPYAGRPGRDTRNGDDEIFAQAGVEGMLHPTAAGARQRAAICLVLQSDG